MHTYKHLAVVRIKYVTNKILLLVITTDWTIYLIIRLLEDKHLLYDMISELPILKMINNIVLNNKPC